jgi:hypothetical protein
MRAEMFAPGSATRKLISLSMSCEVRAAMQICKHRHIGCCSQSHGRAGPTSVKMLTSIHRSLCRVDPKQAALVSNRNNTTVKIAPAINHTGLGQPITSSPPDIAKQMPNM